MVVIQEDTGTNPQEAEAGMTMVTMTTVHGAIGDNTAKVIVQFPNVTQRPDQVLRL